MQIYLTNVKYEENSRQISFIFNDGYKYVKEVPINCHISLIEDNIPEKYNVIKKNFVIFLKDLPNLENCSSLRGKPISTIYFDISPIDIFKEDKLQCSGFIDCIFTSSDLLKEILNKNDSSKHVGNIQIIRCHFLRLDHIPSLECVERVSFESCYFNQLEITKNCSNLEFKKCAFKWLNIDENIDFTGNIIFNNCSFLEKFDCSLLFKNAKSVSFTENILDKTFMFNDTQETKAEYDFSNNTFNGKVEIKNNTFMSDIFFSNSSFNGTADFFGTCFEQKAIFSRVNFNDISVFDKVIFETKPSFQYTTFYDLVVLRDTVFNKGLNLAYINLRDKGGLGFYNESIKNMDYNCIDDQETFRILKSEAQKKGTQLKL